jgi:predicted MFS family arabinose efflux permease
MLSSILATLFLVIREQIGFSGLFFMLAGFSLIYFIVAAFLLPETKGKTVEEVEEFWIKKYE